MAERTYDDFHKLIGITIEDLAADTTEKYISLAIGYLNIYGAGLQEMAGTEGSLSGNYEAYEWAAIMHVTRMVYTDFYEDAGGTVRITLDDGTILYGYECWWTPIGENEPPGLCPDCKTDFAYIWEPCERHKT